MMHVPCDINGIVNVVYFRVFIAFRAAESVILLEVTVTLTSYALYYVEYL